jgi:hypothetical protein
LCNEHCGSIATGEDHGYGDVAPVGSIIRGGSGYVIDVGVDVIPSVDAFVDKKPS